MSTKSCTAPGARWLAVFGLLVGVLVTPVAAVSAVGSAGAGHGHYEAARVLFPCTMLLTRMAGDTITLPLLVLALAQFPCYGATIGFAASKGRTALALVPLLAAHVAAVVLCFSGVIPNFS